MLEFGAFLGFATFIIFVSRTSYKLGERQGIGKVFAAAGYTGGAPEPESLLPGLSPADYANNPAVNPIGFHL